MSPDRDIEIRFTGRRPGEKLAEMLALDPLRTTRHEKVFEVTLDHPTTAVLMETIVELEQAALAGDHERLVAQLSDLIGGRLAHMDSVDITEDRTATAS
jgi:FlaA1/EpsC-like NDP-sugar epimerase